MKKQNCIRDFFNPIKLTSLAYDMKTLDKEINILSVHEPISRFNICKFKAHYKFLKDELLDRFEISEFDLENDGMITFGILRKLNFIVGRLDDLVKSGKSLSPLEGYSYEELEILIEALRVAWKIFLDDMGNYI